jgi:hypothetical protein
MAAVLAARPLRLDAPVLSASRCEEREKGGNLTMKDDAKKQLSQILGVYEEKLAEAERRAKLERAALESFPARFATLRTETIRPALQEFADVLAASGHEAAVLEQEESSSSVGGVKRAEISLRVTPKPFAHKSTTETKRSFVEVAFSANRSERKITVASTSTLLNSGASLGKRGEYEIDAVTADVVAAHVVQTLAEALK